MGSWSEDIYGNDIALDCKSDIDYMLESGESIGDIISKCKYDWHVNNNESIFVLADYQFKLTGIIDKDIEKLLMDAYYEEILNVHAWKEPDKRKESIEKFIDQFNIA